MLNETVASTILTASITGAGLIIAIYALITPISSKIFRDRIESHRKLKEQFDKMKKEISSESSDKEFKRLKTLASEIKEIKTFPKYLGVGVVLVFFGYIFTAFFTVTWLTSPTRETLSEIPILFGFIFSTMAFMFVGFLAIYDVYQAMKGEFEQMKREKEEVERMSEELEKFQRDFGKKLKEWKEKKEKEIAEKPKN